ncbi:MAG: hypothetical protein U5K79_15575 [Cyclobacteriaceae bacterium]|nr:hypothetical protein [Cyclobacteriaceae bacterium]
MEIRDLFVTPLFLTLLIIVAYSVRPFVTNALTKRYFIPALSVKLFGAIALGVIYQFYYGGGDTFTYFNLGSKYIYQAFHEKPMLALKLIFAGKDYATDTFEYATKIYTYGDLSSYFVVRIAGVLDILTFHTYSATATLFAAISFSGLWALYNVFVRLYPARHLGIAIGIFFVPSVFFWGSGIMKDTITLGALGWATYNVYQIFMLRNQIPFNIVILLIAFFSLYTIKIYILLCFIPAAILWVFYSGISKVRNPLVKIMVAPVVLILAGVIGYYSIVKVGEDNPRYDVDQLATTAQITAEWIHYVSEQQGGSAYTLGDFDYSPTGMLRKMPLAIWVTLYRPYLWESHNIVMLLSALESLVLLFFTLFVLYRTGPFGSIRMITSHPILAFCFVFAIVFAFAVGVSTYNFGSLVRYKIPLYPYFVAGLFILLGYSKSERKSEALE